jgi:hypothetical protein
LAELAYHKVAAGAEAGDVRDHLEEARRIAEEIAKNAEQESRQGIPGHEVEIDTTLGSQDWQRDRILAKIARTYARLGQTNEAEDLEAGLSPSEMGPVARERAARAENEDFDAQVGRLDQQAALGDFEHVRAALEAYAQLYGRFYGDSERRASILERIRAAWAKIPATVRVEVLEQMAGFALASEDRAEALARIGEARAFLADAQLSAELRLPYAARLAGMRHAAGDGGAARAELDGLYESYGKARNEIVNMYRCGVLLPFAEAYVRMGDHASAARVYARAVEESVVNPNSRPRAQDLAAVCCSMAKLEFQPSAELWQRLRQISSELGSPW